VPKRYRFPLVGFLTFTASLASLNWACGSNEETGATIDASSPNDPMPKDALPLDAETAHDAAMRVWAPPAMLRAEAIFSADTATATPASWNPNLPKMVSDGRTLYVSHASYPTNIADRKAVILHRPVAGGSWVRDTPVGEEFRNLHQPIGLALDKVNGTGQLHAVFNCVGSSSGATPCYRGGVNSAGNLLRFYHLFFPANAAGVRDLSVYGNANEFTGENNGYMGIGTLSGGSVVWTLNSGTKISERLFQQFDFTSMPPEKTLQPLVAPTSTRGYLYPIVAVGTEPLGYDFVTFLGEYDSAAANNVSYESAVLYGYKNGVPELITQVTPDRSNVDGSTPIGAFDSEAVMAPNGDLHVVAYVRPNLTPGALCADNRLVTVSGVGASRTITQRILPGPSGSCLGTYLKLQVAPNGNLFALAGGAFGSANIGVSTNEGATWTWYNMPLAISGRASADLSFGNYTLIRPDSSPLGYDPKKMVFFFSGFQASQSCSKDTQLPVRDCPDGNSSCQTCTPSTTSYIGELQLQP
jgi:hypothetical protein